MDYFIYQAISRKHSKFDSQSYTELNMVGLDPVDQCLKTYQTYAVPKYRNYSNWADIVSILKHKPDHIVWIQGDLKTKAGSSDPVLINADSVPSICGILPYDTMLKYLEYILNTGVIQNQNLEIVPAHLLNFFKISAPCRII